MKRSSAVLLAPAVLVVGVALAGPPSKTGKAAPQRAHPEVDLTEACDVCHSDATPQVVAEWFTGKHGMNNVKCFVCHGSAGADFVRRAPAQRCQGCHAEQVASLAHPTLVGKDCFSCHPPHLLSPHRLVRVGTAGGAQ